MFLHHTAGAMHESYRHKTWSCHWHTHCLSASVQRTTFVSWIECWIRIALTDVPWNRLCTTQFDDLARYARLNDNNNTKMFNFPCNVRSKEQGFLDVFGFLQVVWKVSDLDIKLVVKILASLDAHAHTLVWHVEYVFCLTCAKQVRQKT